jgi:phenylalanyl-tRNA synthetase beta chain
MNIGYKWIKEYIDIDEDAYTVADALTMSGTEVEEIVHETVPTEVICARLKEVKQHPDADKLSLCLVDTGKEDLWVVCGAPNVREGMISAFAPVGTDLGPGMKVKKAKIRGQESFGVLLSEKELGLTDDHTGIMEIEADHRPGDVLLDALDLEDWVYDINVTPNRGDCLSVIGIARELSALFSKDLKLPDFTITEADTSIESKLSVEILAKDACPRYSARLIEDVNIKKSPFTMRRRLFQSGVRAINNVVDITNYVLLEYGQPLHAFDYTLIADKGIVVRKAHEGERFVTLDSEERTLSADDLLICDKEKPVALAGVMGGENSEVMDTTTSIALESAFFDPVGIRRTSKVLNLSTEASYRFERGIDPEIQVDAANRAAYLMAELADAKVLKGVIDENYVTYEPKNIILRKEYMHKVLGIEDIKDADVQDILARLGCELVKTEEGWNVKPPQFRHDINREVDLIEEFIRIYGMDKVEPELPTFKPIEGATEELKLKELRLRLASMGFAEVVTYSFISPKWKKFFGEEMLELLNPISDEMKLMRSSLIPGLVTTLEKNKNLQNRDVYIFEVGKCFYPRKGQKLPEEQQRLSIALSGRRMGGHWSEKSSEVDFYDIKGIVEVLLPDASVLPSEYGFYKPGYQADIIVDDIPVGHMGALHQGMLEMIDIEDDVYVIEISIKPIFEKSWQGMEEVPKFPMTWRDLSLVVEEAIPYTDIIHAIESKGIKELRSVVPIDLYIGDKLPQGQKGITIRITYQSDSRTLEDKMINKWQEQIIGLLEKDLGITLRQ